MSRSEFIAATAVILFGAFLLGWLLSWMVHRLARPARAKMSEMDRLAQELHEAEEARDRALADQARSEAELRGQLSETRAELSMAVDGLRDARAEIEELRDYIERALARR